MSNIKPIYKFINNDWIKQDAFQYTNGTWVKISEKISSGYNVTLIGQTAIGMAGGVRVKFNTPPDTTIIGGDFDYEAQMGNQADNRLYDSKGNEIDTPKTISNVTKIYITSYGSEYEAKLNDETLNISDGETHEYNITQDSTLILINYWD